MITRMLATLACVGLLSGCSSLDGIAEIIKPVANWAISPCDICQPGSECTPCCHACKVDRCYDYCQEYPHQCAGCESIEYFDCLHYKCVDWH